MSDITVKKAPNNGGDIEHEDELRSIWQELRDDYRTLIGVAIDSDSKKDA